MFFQNIVRSLRQSFLPERDPVEEADAQLVFGLARSRIPNLRQLAYVHEFFTPWERQTVRTISLVSGVAFLALVGVLVLGGSGKPAEGGTYTEGVVGYPERLNPVLANAHSVESALLSLVYRKLFTWNPEGKLVPDLVDTFEAQAGGKSYLLHLRKDVVWEDGELFDADDVMYTFGVIQDPSFQSLLFSRFSNVTLEKRGDFDIMISLPEASGSFLSGLAFGILPEHVWSSTAPQGFGLSSYNQKPIGNGAFRFVSFSKGQDGLVRSYEFERSETYRGAKPYLERVHIKCYPSYQEAEDALTKKNIDGLGGIPKQDHRRIADVSGIGVFDINVPEYVALYLNVKGAEPLRSKEVRAALAQSLSRTGIVQDTLDGAGYELGSVLLRGFEGYDGSVLGGRGNPDGAGEILVKAGWKLVDGVRVKDKTTLKFSIAAFGTPELNSVAEYLKKTFESVGADVDVRLFNDEAEMREAIRTRLYDALLVKVNVGLGGDWYSLFHSSQVARGYNFSQYANRDLDLILQSLRAATTSEIRAQKQKELSAILGKDAPLIPLYSPAYSYAMRTRVKGFEASQLNGADGRFSSVGSWYVKEKLF